LEHQVHTLQTSPIGMSASAIVSAPNLSKAIAERASGAIERAVGGPVHWVGALIVHGGAHSRIEFEDQAARRWGRPPINVMEGSSSDLTALVVAVTQDPPVKASK